MTKDEFIKTCQICGYASKKNATLYANEKEKQGQELTERDFETIHEYNERELLLGKYLDLKCHSSGDQLIDELNINPYPWRRIFDASRGVKR